MDSLDNLIDWANKNNISTDYFPRDKEALKNKIYLDLSNEMITELPPEIGELKNLEGLYISFNNLTTLPNEIGKLKKLTELNLSNNNLSYLPHSIKELTKLRDLNLSNNNFRAIPSEVFSLTNLKSLYLANNQIKEIPQSIIYLRRLMNLNLNNNKIETISKSIFRLQELIYLYLANNNITNIPEEIGLLKELVDFNISNNKLKYVPKNICELENLTYLCLSNNQITSLPSEIGKCSNLYYLDLSKNSLTSIPKELAQIKSLRELKLSNNNIRTIPKELANLPYLESIYISNNNLENLPVELKKISADINQDIFTKKIVAKRPSYLNTILYGVSGIGKTYSLVERALHIIEQKPIFELHQEPRDILNMRFKEYSEQIQIVTFHKNYSYTEFIEGVSWHKDMYEIQDGVFKKIVKRAIKNPEKNFVMLIDDIDNGNINEVFGEVLTLLDEDRRLGNSEELEITLPYSHEKFGLPNNLYIIATATSLNSFDKEIIRKFEFIKMYPDYKMLGLVDGVEVGKMLEVINERIEYLLSDEYLIGHTYFLHIMTIEELKEVFLNVLIPLLSKYFKNNYEKIRLIFGDNQKEREYQFITKKDLDMEKLFRVDAKNYKTLYKVNLDAFTKKESYIKIYKGII